MNDASAASPAASPPPEPPAWPVGGGATGALIRTMDWSRTSLGPIAQWPRSLRLGVEMVLDSPVAMVLMWGPDHVMIYNDGYVPIAADRHPAALGGTVPQIWPEIWDWNQEKLAAGLRGEQQVYRDQMLRLQRRDHQDRDHLEEVWFDLYYAPVRDECGTVRGVLCTAPVTTERVLSERRLNFLLDLSERLRDEVDPHVVTGVAAEALGRMLGVDRVGYAVIESESGVATIQRDWTAGPLESLAGRTLRLDHFGTEIARPLLAGESVWMEDTAGSAADPLGIRSFLAVPLLKAGRLTTILYLHSRMPRRWTEAEITLSQDVAARTWSTVERARVESRLRASEDRLRIAQAAGGIGTFELFPAAGRVAVSGQFCRLWGLPERSEFAIEDVLALVHPEDRAKLETSRRQLGVRALAPVEYRIIRPDTGELRWLARRGETVTDGPAGAPRYLGACYDITDRRRAEDRLRELNDSLEREVALRTRERDRIWTVSQDHLVVADAAGVWLSVNPAWSRTLGWSETELVGRQPDWIEHPDDRGVTRRALVALVDGAGGPHATGRFESRLRTADGTYRHFSWTAAAEGERIYGVARDSTLDKQRETALAHAQEALRQSQKMEAIGQLTGGIAHDFNNLLMAITGALDLLQRRLNAGRTDGLERYAGLAAASADRAAQLTQRLLAFARRQPLDPKPVRPERLLAGMDDLLRRTLGPTIALDIVAREPAWHILCDGNQLESAVLNLAINARDAMPEGGRLTISTDNRRLDAEAIARLGAAMPPGDYLVIAAADTGIGMDADTRSHAFEPFFTTKPTGHGTGLGLSMLYGFVRQSGGHARVESELGHGATFELYLPRFEGEGPAGEDAPVRDVAANGAGEIVLVVEDEDAVRELVLDVLRERGYRAIAAADGMAGLDLLRTTPEIDLLVTDVGLPGGMNGRQLADAARHLRPDLKVLFMTGYAHDAWTGRPLLDEGMELLTKPFAVELLAQKLRGMLGAATPG
ncbi:MAG TPA: PAS domain S-box protein [Xanthobacteraceae bacterium]|nr:PAS domain S-box protein [Xanthobacteraceae bacterium]